MFKKVPNYKKIQRRIYNMFQNSFRKLKLLVLMVMMAFMVSVLLYLPNDVIAGQSSTDLAFTTIQPGSNVAGYWDLRDRETYFQVTNVSGAPITVHIQTFNASDQDPEFKSRCTEFNFFDNFTGNDTHIYNLRNLTKNDGGELFPPILDDGHGYIVATVGAPGAGCASPGNEVLLANFRIIDTVGDYEYRSLVIGDWGFSDVEKGAFGFNFNEVDDTTFSDVVVMVMQINDKGDCAGDPKAIKWQRGLVGLNEDRISCDDRPPLGCNTSGVDDTTVPLINLGINQRLVNSRGGSLLCSGTAPNGWMIMADENGDKCEDDNKLCGGWIGLNNGDKTGSMETWVGLAGEQNDYFGTD